MTTFKGMDTFPTDYISVLRYTLNMPFIDDDTKIVENNFARTIDNFAVKTNFDGSFQLQLFHALKVTDNHVDEAAVVGTWDFTSLDQLKDIQRLIEGSVIKHL